MIEQDIEKKYKSRKMERFSLKRCLLKYAITIAPMSSLKLQLPAHYQAGIDGLDHLWVAFFTDKMLAVDFCGDGRVTLL